MTRPIFVTGSGRSGTNFIAEWLKRYDVSAYWQFEGVRQIMDKYGYREQDEYGTRYK